MTPKEVANKLRELARESRFRSVREDLLVLSDHLSPPPLHHFEREIYMVRSWREDVEDVMQRMQLATPSLDLIGRWWEQVADEVSCVPDDVIGVFDVCAELLDNEMVMTSQPAKRTSTVRFRVLLTFEYDDTWIFTDDADTVQRVIYNLGGVRGEFELCSGRS